MKFSLRLKVFQTLIILAAPLGFLIFWGNQFPYPVGSIYSDLTISHYPNIVFIRNTINQYHQLPLWSDAILSGYPFAANPLSSLWYFPAWFSWVLPLPFGINLLICAHLFFGGTGMFLFLRRLQFSEWASLAGAISFELMPKLLGHYSAGHMTLVFAVTWTPWLLLQEIRSHKIGRGKRYLSGVILGMILLADVRWAAYASIFWGFFSLYQFFHRHLSETPLVERVFPLMWAKTFIIWLFQLVQQVFVGIFIAAPLLFPLAQYIQFASRNQMVVGDNLSYSLPWEALIGLVFPNMAGNAEQIVYNGGLSLMILIWVLSFPALRKKSRFWLIVIGVSIAFSLGSNIPGMNLVTQLPGLNLLRVPSRGMIIAGMASCVIIAEGIDALLSSHELPLGKSDGLQNLILVAAVFSTLLMAVGISYLTGSVQIEFVWGAAFSLIFAVVIILRKQIKNSKKWLVIILLPLLTFDLFGVDYSQFQLHSSTEVLSEGYQAANYLANKKGIFRVYSPSYSIPQHTAAEYHLEMADGIDPLQISRYVDFMEFATGVPVTQYSVTLPPFSSGNPKEDNRPYRPDPILLGLMNVRYIAADFDVTEIGLSLLARFGETRIYENHFVMPRAWVQPIETSQLGLRFREEKISYRTPNMIRIEADGPGKLFISEINYPGWEYHLNGNRVEAPPSEDLLRNIELPAGLNSIEIIYKPIYLYIGLLFSLVTLSILLLTGKLF